MPDLLEYLSEALHCLYLSDLHYVTVAPGEADALLDLPDGQFSLEEYQHAADYLTGGHGGTADLAAARNALRDILIKQK